MDLSSMKSPPRSPQRASPIANMPEVFMSKEAAEAMVPSTSATIPSLNALVISAESPANDPVNEDAALIDTSESLSRGTDSDTVTASTQILEGFPKAPLEIRQMIYAATINKPRLLDFLHAMRRPFKKGEINYRQGDAAPLDANLPTCFFLNKEAYNEIMRHIILIPQARDDNLKLFPWSYVNPNFDTLYFPARESWWPRIRQAPGIQTIALAINEPWTRDVFPGPDYSSRERDKNIVDKIRERPDLKEVIFVRSLLSLTRNRARGGDNYCFQKEKDEYGGKQVPNIYRHHCGVLGAINNDIEDILSGLPTPYYCTRPGVPDPPFHLPSELVVRNLEKILTKLNDEKYPGTKLPAMSAAYSHWLDADGSWQWAQSNELD